MADATFHPDPAPAPLATMILAQARLELGLTLRNGEQLVLTVVIPALLLVLFGGMHVGGLGGQLDFLVPGVMTVAVLSTAFTGQAIATGFDRRAGVLKRLSASPLPRSGLIAGKTISVLVIEIMQLAVVGMIGRLMGWSPAPPDPTRWLLLILLFALGTAAFSGLGLLMAGTLRAEATLPAANLIFLLLLGGGGVIAPLTRYPSAVRVWIEILPTAALADGWRELLAGGAAISLGPSLILLLWAAGSVAAAAATFRWE
ncbi:MAG TPA: ABC transporter permease [Candidatus Nitrosotalea sp.]|nr:ABC transporter permease [Candidatus Nitrosotalea sp.]